MARQPKAPRMLTHGQIWTALDQLAERAGLSPSGLAKRSGLDPTTFNKSKRITADGRERWPSTESVAKALAATNSSIDTFVQLIGDGARGGQSVPLLGFAQAGNGGYFDDSGFPAGKGWDVVAPGTPIRRGDRVVVKTSGGEVMVKEMKRRTAKTLELQSLNPNHADRTLAADDVEWIARIVWASQ